MDRDRREEEDDVDRRELLRLLALSTATAADPERVVHALRVLRKGEVDRAWLDDASYLTRALVRAYPGVRPGDLLPRVRAHLDRLERPRSRALPWRARTRLARTTCETAALGGWLAFTLTRWGEARALLELAITRARETDEPGLVSQALTLASALDSSIPLGGSSPSPGAQLRLREAIALGRRGVVGSISRAWMYARLAEERATTRDEEGFHRALLTAHRALEAPRDERDYERFLSLDAFLAYLLDEDALQGYQGIGLALLGSGDEALALLGGALAKAHDPLQRAALHTELARAYALVGEPEEGIAHAHRALDLSSELGAPLRARRLEGVASSLTRYDAMGVRELGDRLRALS